MRGLSGKALLVTALVVLVLVPVGALAAGGFTDVPDGNVFAADIQWLAAAGVTKGCNPPANDRFCPDEYVTRGQMAAFMHRLAINRVVDADTLDGKDSTAFLGTTSKAADANKLDGIDSTGFVQTVQILTAAISYDGVANSEVGNAVSAERTAKGVYRVHFDRTTLGCVATVTVGWAHPIPDGWGGSYPSGPSAIVLGYLNGDGFYVQTFDRDGGAWDASFHLIAVCPTDELTPAGTSATEPIYDEETDTYTAWR